MNTENNRMQNDDVAGSRGEEGTGQRVQPPLLEEEAHNIKDDTGSSEGNSQSKGEQGTSTTPGPAEEGRS